MYFLHHRHHPVYLRPVGDAHLLPEALEPAQQITGPEFGGLEMLGAAAWVLAGLFQRAVGQLYQLLYCFQMGGSRRIISLRIRFVRLLQGIVGMVKRGARALLRVRLGLDPGQLVLRFDGTFDRKRATMPVEESRTSSLTQDSLYYPYALPGLELLIRILAAARGQKLLVTFQRRFVLV